jgi:hypothetical protein
LQCKHCCKKRNDINIYKQRIRKICNKKGIKNGIVIKTCDIQQANNTLKNPENNKHNNEFYRKIKKPELEIINQELLLEKHDSKYNEKIHYDSINIYNEIIKKRILEGRTTGKYKLREIPCEKLIEPVPVVFTIPEICKIVNDLNTLNKKIEKINY